MAVFRAHLLDRFYLSRNGEPISGFRSEKVQALLAYLLLEAESPVSRTHLAQLLWWGYAETSARLSLRQALFNLNQLFAPHEVLLTSRLTVQLKSINDLLTNDLSEIRALSDRDPATLKLSEWQTLEATLGYEFLDGFDVIDSAPFLSWLEKQRTEVKKLQCKIAELLPYKPKQKSVTPLLSLPKHNLPRLFTPFYGRQQEIEQVVQHILHPDLPLLVLLGEGGIGKTRLALSAAQAIIKQQEVQAATAQSVPFPDGVWFVPLANPSVTEPALAIASALIKELRLQLVGKESLVEQTLYYFERKSLLLILDNFETLIGGVDFILELLKRAKQLKLLVTSRQRLHLQAETIQRVEGLPIPNSAGEFAGDLHVEPFPSMQLFVERAMRTSDGFVLTRSNYTTVAAICNALHGNPLAIELAAAQTEHYTPVEILQALQNTSNALATDLHDLPLEHRSLRTVLDRSWRLLTNTEQEALALCSIFRQHFTAEAVEIILNLADETPLLQKMIDTSWLNSEVREGQTVYFLHEIVRDYAAYRRQELALDLCYQVQKRHADYYLQSVNALEKARQSTVFYQIITTIQHQLANVQAAWHWAVDEKQYELLEQSSQALALFYHLAGFFREGEKEFLAALATIQSEGASETNEIALPRERAYCMLFCSYSQLLVNLAEYASAAAKAEEAVVLASKLQSPRLTAIAMYRLAVSHLMAQERANAHQLLEQAFTLARQTDEKRIEVRCLLWLGNLALLDNQFDEAQRYGEEGIGLARHHQFPEIECELLNFLARIFTLTGKIVESRPLYEQALRIAQEMGSLRLQSTNLSGLGIAYDRLGDFVQAQAYYQESLQVFRETGDRNNQARVLGNLGISSDYLGDYASAYHYSEQCLQIWQELGARPQQTVVLVNLAMHTQHMGDYEAALDYANQALRVSQDTQNLSMQRYAWVAQGYALAMLRRYEEANSAYQEALQIAQKLKMLFMEIEPLAGLVQLGLQTGQLTQSVADYAATIAAFLQTDGLESLEEPMLVMATYYQYLHATENADASLWLDQAYQILMKRAEKIQSGLARTRFLQNVAAHKLLVDAWSALQITTARSTTA
ncbi:MAG: tetratricopeptide repeat protein [Caldilineaceae bacterium]